jgi:hypothetical protein
MNHSMALMETIRQPPIQFMVDRKVLHNSEYFDNLDSMITEHVQDERKFNILQ